MASTRILEIRVERAVPLSRTDKPIPARGLSIQAVIVLGNLKPVCQNLQDSLDGSLA